MLIIAIPKSASTSVMSTLGKLHNLEYKQDTTTSKNFNKPKGTSYLHKLHGDLREINHELVKKWTSSKTIHKQHVFPSKNNLFLLKEYKKIVLLRDPIDIILAYQRGVEKGIQPLPEGFKYRISQTEWIRRAKITGLYNDLELFYSSWIANVDSNTLIIQYNDVINKTNFTFRKIEYFFDLIETEKEIKLDRKRYSSEKTSMKLRVRLSLKKYYHNFLADLKFIN
jgi:hypothetical protein